MNHLKSHKITWNHLIFVFKIFDFFSLIYKMENPNYKDENIERKYLTNM